MTARAGVKPRARRARVKAGAPGAAAAGAPPPGQDKRERWLHALSAVDDPRHAARSLVLYRLLKLANLIHRPFYADDAVRYRISLNELRVLMTLAPLGEAASHELVTVAGMHPMNVSRAVATLRRNGRVQERRDGNNRRRKLLQLTPAGRALYRRQLPHVRQIAAQLFEAMTPAEISTLSRLTDLMTASLERFEERGEPGSR